MKVAWATARRRELAFEHGLLGTEADALGVAEELSLEGLTSSFLCAGRRGLGSSGLRRPQVSRQDVSLCLEWECFGHSRALSGRE